MKSQFQYVLSADYYPPINKQLGICNQELSDQFCRSFEPASTNPDNVTRITKFETESVEPIIFVHSKQDFDSERFNQIFNRTALNKSGHEKSKSLLFHHYLLILFKKTFSNCKKKIPNTFFTLNYIWDPNLNLTFPVNAFPFRKTGWFFNWHLFVKYTYRTWFLTFIVNKYVFLQDIQLFNNNKL